MSYTLISVEIMDVPKTGKTVAMIRTGDGARIDTAEVVIQNIDEPADRLALLVSQTVYDMARNAVRQ